MRIVLVGLPGAGKGTQAAYLAKNLSVPHVSTGDLFRVNIRQGTELGKQAQEYMRAGQLVPDEITIGMARSRMKQPDAVDGFLLDGFPRSVFQAEALDQLLKDDGTRSRWSWIWYCRTRRPSRALPAGGSAGTTAATSST